MSADESVRLRRSYRQFEVIDRVTPSGRRYYSIAMIEPNGSGVVYAGELTADGSRALRSLSRCEFTARS